MMGIAHKVAREFADGVRSRGQSYFAKGRVVITSAKTGEMVVAKVRGTESYKVKLRLRGNRLSASCTCPYFGPEGEPCKHLWATILASDARNLLIPPPERPLVLLADVRYHLQQHQPGDPPPHDGDDDLAPPPLPALPAPAPPPRGDNGQDYSSAPPPRTAYGPAFPNAYPPSSSSPYGPGPDRTPSAGYGPARGYGSGPGSGSQHSGRAPSSGYGSGSPRGPNSARGPASKGDKERGARGKGGAVPGPNIGPGYRVPEGYPAGADGQQRYISGRGRANKVRGPGVGPGRIEPNKAREPKTRPSMLYVVDAPSTLNQNQVVITLARRHRRPGTDRASLKPWWQPPLTGPGKADPEDRDLLLLLNRALQPAPPPSTPAAPAPPQSLSAILAIAASTGVNGAPAAGPTRFVIRPEMHATVVERLCRSGRCRLRRTEDEDDPPALRWDDGRPWRFVIETRLADAASRRWVWRGALHRNNDRMDLAEPMILLPGLVVQGVGRAARFDDMGVFAWMLRLRHEKEMTLSEAQQDSMLGRILGESPAPASELIEGLDLEQVDLPPTPCLMVRTPRQNWGSDNLIAELVFDYDGAKVPSFPAGKMVVQTSQHRAIRRDVPAELRAKERLDELGFREAKDFRVDPGTMEIAPKRVPQTIRELVGEGWRVEAEGIIYRPASDFKLAVTSGIDWFELDGRIDFGGQKVPLPEILEAARRGETMLKLGDGSIGMLPEDWLSKYGLLADLGDPDENGLLRFGRAQAGLLDSLLAAQPGATCDAEFRKVRKELHAFEGIEAIEAPPGFQGTLRPYQCEGLGWLEYLRKFDFGGILADDMGLGKTIQVLALLQRRRARRQSHGPSLIVVPRSLVFNWMQEAAKFTPRLDLLDYTGPSRHSLRERFDEYDLVVTTYGTLRSDAAELSKIEFEYAILDEAQAIKNSDSQSAKAARLLKARHRLAMSGTPIENHLGELWSIFEFLNPGMLGTASVFKRHANGLSGQDVEARTLLAKALRPFILRRTKQQVVKDLPDKLEQTLHVDMEPAQRQLYENLKAHYRNALLRKDPDALRTSKIEVLEALLRLRQAACHPALIDPERANEPSAKLDMLLPQLEEVIEEGHKVLVFSQFTSFLALVRTRLDAAKIPYEYLDGRTRNREERVNHFQEDPNCPVFLISLKAGGLGLNLTAAEYVYLLDPWWNPAVEAQAIDRSHRIGQTRRVFAYRIICRDTVEQKILELQQKKRDLADAILNADNRLIQTLTKDDLEFLLS
jgi:superfamily II DNA or RNA helicase